MDRLAVEDAFEVSWVSNMTRTMVMTEAQLVWTFCSVIKVHLVLVVVLFGFAQKKTSGRDPRYEGGQTRLLRALVLHRDWSQKRSDCMLDKTGSSSLAPSSIVRLSDSFDANNVVAWPALWTENKQHREKNGQLSNFQSRVGWYFPSYRFESLPRFEFFLLRVFC
jgi:hypothetical protein